MASVLLFSSAVVLAASVLLFSPAHAVKQTAINAKTQSNAANLFMSPPLSQFWSYHGITAKAVFGVKYYIRAAK
jgi:hypothetical protein